ncbi:acetylhydrolase [Mucilaginibacter limnophilus]|uniref:Acetylhydrolase n=1 Tax=Mucilaginibacter limnophilus TaxID=1932778 RepID=A0A437MUA3_9SPHI|nr:SGNH/GDSL hydrolase family protein [Mucilaginibacter limnophilus]RVU01217.1 acetylhydrolase [Mucilaginibacter limnophilus]
MTNLFKLWFTLLAVTALYIKADAQSAYDWHKAEWAIGICEPDTENVFHRLPARLQSRVAKGVWNQSLNSAGEYLHIRTTARSFTIKYRLSGKTYHLRHMPSTGVSGLDLYAKDIHGQWNWAPPAKYAFGDTCVYEYKDLKITARNTAEFYLYLPLYAIVQEIVIGIPQGERFEYLKPDHDLPIVAYGTSIMQGAVASRPGLAWTNMLHRALGRDVINLGFSGNGRFDAPIFDLMAEVNARLYILDCMPNLFIKKYFPPDTIISRLRYGISKLRARHPEVPILLAEHPAGAMPDDMDTATVSTYHLASLTIKKIYDQLAAEGVTNLHLLNEAEINFDINSTTDGTHPNDRGMMQYARAYEKKIRLILAEPVGDISTQRPVEQYRDGFDWRKRHEEIIDLTSKDRPEVIIFGNSIINYWGGKPKPEKVAFSGEDAWQRYMEPSKVQNAGFGNDRIENVLWRVYHGELDQFKGKKIVLMIGTNNLVWNTDGEILKGLTFLIEQIKTRQPAAIIYMSGILPRRSTLQRVLALNSQIKRVAKLTQCRYFDFSKSFLQGKSLNDHLFKPDGLHPNAEGYEVLGKCLEKMLN